jgi:O-antigen biosynthesis protein
MASDTYPTEVPAEETESRVDQEDAVARPADRRRRARNGPQADFALGADDGRDTGPAETAAATAIHPEVAGVAVGFVESVDRDHVRGWAWYRPTPDESIDVEILVDDVVVLKVRADQPRPDLATAGAGHGRHGFLVRDFQDFLPPGAHVIRVRRARDLLELPGSPVRIAVPDDRQDSEAPAGADIPVGALESIDHTHILGWAWNPDAPDESVEIEVVVDGAQVLEMRADLARPDLADAGRGAGRHGFVVHNLASFLSVGRHTVRVRRASDHRDLAGSPTEVSRGDPNIRTTKTEAEPAPSSAPAAAPGLPLGRMLARGGIEPEPAREDADEARAIGNVDRICLEEISGWVWDPVHPNDAVDIEILDGDTVVLKMPADQLREDLIARGKGNGRHGFTVPNVGGIFPLSRHRVRVRRASDGWDLPASPAWITRAVLDDKAKALMSEMVFTAIEGAATADDLAEPLGHLLTLLNDVVNAQEGLARMRDTPNIPPAEAAEVLHLSGRTRELVDQVRYAYAPLYFEPAGDPEVSVIIPVHNQFRYTYDCLKSMLAALPERTFEVIIMDDFSVDETLFAALVFAGGVRLGRNSKNLGFVGTCNAGAALARGKYLLFLNNDTLVQPGWLDELVETFEQVPNVGIAGSKLLFADGKLQEAGGIIWRLGDGWNWGRGRDPNEPAFCYLRDADWVSGAALMIPGDLFRDLNGFDEYYAPAYYEDTDIAFRVRARGLRVVVQPASVITHLEGVSAGTDTAGTGMKRFQVINHAKFYRRWKDTLITHRLNGQQPELEAERQVRRRAWFIDDSVPTPDQDAGSNAAVEHMRCLMAMGYKVTFLPADNMAAIEPYTGRLQKLGIECLHYPFFWSVEEVFRKAAVKPDLIYLHRHSNASKYATMARRYFPHCRVVYSVADLHFLRMERQAAVEPGSMSAAEAAAQRRDELGVMANVDAVIVHSSMEAALLREADGGLDVRVVPWTVRVRPAPAPFAERSGAAFVGGFGHPPNGDAVRFLVNDIAPLLRAQAPECTVWLVGSKMPAEIMNLQVPGVTPLGFVPNLADILHRLRCTIVPLRYGAGIKGKVLESFAHGLPCVMSEVAAEGLELPEDLAWLVARSPGEFAEKVARVHADEGFNRMLAESGLAYVARRHGAGVVTEALRTAVVG